MSSPVAKRRQIAKIAPSSDDEYESANDDEAFVHQDDNQHNTSLKHTPMEDSPLNKTYHTSKLHLLSQPHPTLPPDDSNVSLQFPKLDPSELEPLHRPLTAVQRPESPSRTKTPFSGANLVQLSPRKAKIQSQLEEKPKEAVVRLVIDKLVLNNFKSYAGEQVIGPFHTSFSAVVGPNGSGKSNVIDSMLFVFGFRANKMRQSKLSELIHNSEAAPNLQSCSVDIHFMHVSDNLDGTTTPVESSHLVISRTAYKNNGSDYFINGKKSNYKEVTTLLKDKGIDLDHKRFLILQGEVESIAQMKAKAEGPNDDGLLEYLEDIIGTSSYKQSIEDSYQKIEELNVICQEKESRFDLVEKDKRGLEQRKDEALQLLSKENQLTEAKSVLYQCKIYHAEKKLDATNMILSEFEESLAKEKERTAEITKEITLLETQHNEALEDSQRVVSEIKKLEDFQKKGDREKVALEEKKKSTEGKIKKSQKLLDIAITAMKEAESKLLTASQENTTYMEELESLKLSLIQERSILDEIRSELTEKTKGLTTEIEVQQTKLEPWKKRLDQKKSEIAIAESQVQMFVEERAQLESDIAELEERIKQISTETATHENDIKLLEEEYVHNESQIKMGNEECESASVKLESMGSDLSSHRQRTIEARSSLSTMQNKNKVLAALMRLQETGRIQGFYGRLGDLGYIDDKYDVAISTACGQLDDMVVETVEVGQQCIEYLRKNSLGYSRFILLNKLRNFNLSPIRTPNNVPRLFDLVRPKDSKFANAFYSVLQDTLVASNMKEANQVAYGSRRYRVVTLDGKLIDKSGTLSGGGHTVSRGGMKSTSQVGEISESEVFKLEKELAEKESRYNLAQNTLFEMRNGLKGLKDRQPEIDTLISQYKFDIESLNNELKNSKFSLQELKKAQEAMLAKRKETSAADSKVKQLKAEHAQLVDESKEIQARIDDLQEKIMEVGGVRLRMQDSKVDSVKQKIEIVTKKLSQNRLLLKKLENELKRYTKSKKEEQEQEIEDLRNELGKMEKAYQQKIEVLDNFEEELSKQKFRKEEFDSKAESMKQKLDERQDAINELRSTQIEIENDINIHKTGKEKAKRTLQNCKDLIESLQITDYSELLSFLDSEEEISRYTKPSVSELSPDEIEAQNVKKLEAKVEELESYVKESKADIETLKEYAEKAAEYSSRKKELNDAVAVRDEERKFSDSLKKKRLDEFMEGFNIISGTLKEMYQMITMGGNAELELVDSLDPFSEGILFSVMPPKKSWKNISNLSGGEKTLSSLALVFALHTYKPTPLYVMDEIDAALDFRNVSIVANYIKERTKNAQFVVISLRNNMFELAQQLVGIYKVNNMTRSITLQNRDMLGST